MNYVYAEMVGVWLQWQGLLWCGFVVAIFRNYINPFSLDWFDYVSVFSFAVAWHFIFYAFDGSYWQLAWSAKLAGNRYWQLLFQNGIIANIPFRHIGMIFIAFLHIRAKTMLDGTSMDGYILTAWLVAVFSSVHVAWLVS